ncbi:adenylosuccinate lyase [Actinacidiphila sp. ITFR-21]|uniref:adenylosuccinate lyase n=1 Tax=Actinacidiphila sp. ITFR-21 TaxID=3075199 RepID=UPI00288BEA52|nr:adenylosuccinate lyase [Streptomyces sp. ITFR-21]WNI18605.1 adenylosuccinate lyase [Streptomyces sp. ITFR-21]
MDPATRERLALALTAPGRPLDVREAAAVELAGAGDRRAFETLALLLNHQDEARARQAAKALLRLGDPRTGRAAAVLATNPLRTGYALPAIRLLVDLRAPEAVPALTETLQRLRARPRPALDHIARACAEGLETLRTAGADTGGGDGGRPDAERPPPAGGLTAG